MRGKDRATRTNECVRSPATPSATAFIPPVLHWDMRKGKNTALILVAEQGVVESNNNQMI